MATPVLGELVRRFHTQRRAAVAAMQVPEFAEAFREISAELYTAPDGELAVKIFAGTEETFWLLAAEALAEAETGAAGDGRPPGSFVGAETFWAVWEMAVAGESARGIAKRTDKRRDRTIEHEFVNRDKAGVIVAAVKKNRAAARRALDGRKTPGGFSATPDGVKLPDL